MDRPPAVVLEALNSTRWHHQGAEALADSSTLVKLLRAQRRNLRPLAVSRHKIHHPDILIGIYDGL